jgi:3',5'-cyclic AMP phosphodiesterase CpdA
LLAGDLTEHGRLDDLRAIQTIFSHLDVPTYVVIGNHDYESRDSRLFYERVFPGRLNYEFNHRGWQFIGLDTSDGQRYEGTSIQHPTLAWLDTHLPTLDPAKPTVVFTHFPLGDGVTYRPRNADALLERFLDFNLQAVFNGHFHGFTERTFERAAVTTNKCCALKRGNHDKSNGKGYFVCRAHAGRLEREYVEIAS